MIGSLESVWEKEFAKALQRLWRRAIRTDPTHLFSDAVNTGCGRAAFIESGRSTVRRSQDLSGPEFLQDSNKLAVRKPQFSQAYVMAHEYGHHIQNLLGIQFSGADKTKTGSVRLELQADYLAGVWAHQADKQFHILQGGDLESAIQSANSIGDDTLQKRSGSGFSHPEKYTHGTSAQRVKAFSAGYRTGDASKAKLDRFFSAQMTCPRGELDDSLFR